MNRPTGTGGNSMSALCINNCIVLLLIQQGADVNLGNLHVWHHAVTRRAREMEKAVASSCKGAQVDSRSEKAPLH